MKLEETLYFSNMKALVPLLFIFVGIQTLSMAEEKLPYFYLIEGKFEFEGTEWGDEVYNAQIEADIPEPQQELTLKAVVNVKKITSATWGDFYKIDFHLKKEQGSQREIIPLYFLVLPNKIYLFNVMNPEREAKRLLTKPNPPPLEKNDLRAIDKGSILFTDNNTKITIQSDGKICSYLYSHNSGHFTSMIWKKGKGLMEYAQGYGAERDGYRLKRKD